MFNADHTFFLTLLQESVWKNVDNVKCQCRGVIYVTEKSYIVNAAWSMLIIAD